MTDYRYVELRTASAFTFLEAASQPEDLARRAADLGYQAIAMADADGVYGIPRFVKAAREAGVKPIVGATVTMEVAGNRDAAEPVAAQRREALHGASVQAPRLLLLCEDESGWSNLCELLTEAHRGRNKGEARTDFANLERFHNGLVAIGGGAQGPVLHAARMNGREAGAQMAGSLASIFGNDSFFLDIQRHGDPAEEHANRFLLDLCDSLKLPCIASNDVRYHVRKRGRLCDVLAAIRNHVTLDAAGSLLDPGHGRYLVKPTDAARAFSDLPGVLAATADLADRLGFGFRDTGYSFPRYPTPRGETEFSILYELVHQGVRERYRPVTARVMRQITHEMDLIGKLGLAGYFLLVWDIVRFCRENDILAQGRGSAANSAVCYALAITAVDPIAYDLLFERFLSEERGEWPDIDLDLPSGDDREKVIQYVYRHHGTRSVGMTAAVITYRGRSAVREVGKVLDLDPYRLDRLSRLMGHFDFHDSPDELEARVREAGLDPGDVRVARFMDCFRAIRGLPRHLSQHNGGLVIAGGRLDRVVPLEPARMPGRTVIQWDKDDLDDLHMIKVDLLGLGMLAAIKETTDLVRRHEDVKVDLAHLPQDDPDVFHMLRRADTVGVFQVESRAQMATLPRMKPTCFYDLVVEVAIIRPGPIVGKMVSPYLQRRAGLEPIRYAHPSLEPILKRTLGIPLFQEQLMRMAMAVGGFTGGQAEELRRALGARRSTERMQRLMEQLSEGMERKGIPKSTRDEIVKSIISFALYGFPESHAASFALIAYASAWLKCHHQAAFVTALLNQWPMGFYHPSTLVRDAQRHGVEVRPVDVAHSQWECSMEEIENRSSIVNRRLNPRTDTLRANHAVRLGLKYVKGLSQGVGARIVKERTRGAFTGVVDLAARTNASSSEVFALARVGALASLGRHRRDAMWQALAAGSAKGMLKDAIRGTPDEALEPMDATEETAADYGGIGLSTAHHPMSLLRPELDHMGAVTASDLAGLPDGRWVRLGGMVIVRQRPGTAKGFFFATLEDETDLSNIVVTPDRFKANRALLSTEPFLLVEGRLQNRSGVASIKAARFKKLSLPLEHRGRNFC
ncbi:MAG: DNA polymerase III subunit alpha [Deltaproteobacteria bacterium]|nr:DNA polymerase III subunit alpha [Deltaproteobacteria bacterium]